MKIGDFPLKDKARNASKKYVIAMGFKPHCPAKLQNFPIIRHAYDEIFISLIKFIIPYILIVKVKKYNFSGMNLLN